MSDRFRSGSSVLWTSNPKASNLRPHGGRKREVRIVTEMKANPGLYLVAIVVGLPGEKGTYRMVPERVLAAT